MKKENGKIIDASSRFEDARKKADTKKVAEKIKENLQKDGLEVIDPNEFFDAIQQVKEAPLMPFILAAKNTAARIRPDLFKSKGINLDNVEEKINKIYGKNGEEETESILYSLKQILKHVVYFLETNPNEEELDNTIESLKILLSGRWFDQK